MKTAFRALGKPLQGIVVGISVSETSAIRSGGIQCGFDSGEVDRTVRIVAQDLLADGAGVMLGHDWRPGGVMWEVVRLAQAYQPPVSLRSPAPAPLQNWIPWPDPLPLDEDDREALKGILQIESAGLPPGLEAVGDDALRADPPSQPYFRARALTHMRRTLVQQSHARVCLGGRLEGSSGRYPGIIEESLLTVAAAKPLYVSPLLGCASGQVVQALQGDPMPDDFATTRDDVKQAFDRYAAALEPGEPDARIDREEVWRQFADFGIDGLAATNGLTAEENRSLFQAQNVSEIRYWLLRGLNRLRSQGKI